MDRVQPIAKKRAIIFDLDGTLNDSTMYPSFRQAATQALIASAPEGSRLRKAGFEEVLALYDALYKENKNAPDHINQILRHYGLPEIAELVRPAVMAYHQRKIEVLKPYDGVIPFVRRLRMDHVLGVVTNGDHRSQIDKLSIMKFMTPNYFDVIVTSGGLESKGIDKERAEKPHQYPYEFALEGLNVAAHARGTDPINPSDVLTIDDRIENLVGAKKVGFETLWFRKGKYAETGPKEFAAQHGIALEQATPTYTLGSWDLIQRSYARSSVLAYRRSAS